MQQFDESRAKTRPIYYTNNIGIASPGNKTTYSFLIDGKSENGVEMVFVLEEFLRWGARILSQSSWVFEAIKEFTLSITCDLKDSKETSDDFIIKLRSLRFVNNAKVISLKRRMFTGSLFPLTMMDTNRVVALNPEGFFRIQDHLKTHAKKSDLVDAGRDVGKDIVSQIREKFEAPGMSSVPNLDDVIKDNVIGFMSAAGWGKFRWEQDKNNAQRVMIQDPPTVSYGGTAAGNYFLQGIVAALTEEFFHRRFTVMEDHYENEIRLLTLSMLDQESTNIGSDVQEDQLSEQDKAVALIEVKKIIQSLEKGVSPIETSNIALEQTRKEGISLVVPGIAVGDQVHFRTASKNDLSPKTLEKDMSVLSNVPPEFQTKYPRGGDRERNPGESQRSLGRLNSPRQAESLRFFELLKRLFSHLTRFFHSSDKDKQLIFETTERTAGSNVVPSSSEQATRTADPDGVKRTIEIELGNTKFEEKAIGRESSESASLEVTEVKAIPTENTTNRLEVSATPGEPIHLERKTAIVRNESDDSENDVLSPSSEDEIYYRESFD